MVHYKLKSSEPSATVVSRNPKTSSLDEMKLYEGKYFFLKNNQEFQIRIFNPLDETIGAKIIFNDQSSNSLLVIRPGEDITIDRFLDEKNKMLFETYQYDSNNKAAEKAVAKNGLLSIEFYKEIKYTYNYTNINIYNERYNYPNYNRDLTIPYYYGGSDTFMLHDNIITYTDTNGIVNTNNAKFENNEYYTSNISFDENSKKELNLKETGRIEKGEKSDQEFKLTNMSFEYYPFHTIKYELKPLSEHKNIISTDIKVYCTECGYRIRKKTWKFCPKCGEKIV